MSDGRGVRAKTSASGYLPVLLHRSWHACWRPGVPCSGWSIYRQPSDGDSACWRRTMSNSAIAPAVAAFKDDTCPCIGSLTSI